MSHEFPQREVFRPRIRSNAAIAGAMPQAPLGGGCLALALGPHAPGALQESISLVMAPFCAAAGA